MNVTPEGYRVIEEVANRNGVSIDAALTLLNALALGNGAQAQFNHPDLGGMGQWSQGGMIMIGDMFNQGLKFRVDTLCNELSRLLRDQPLFAPVASMQSQRQGDGGVSLFVPGSSGSWWPAGLGAPASTGSQNDLRYAFFPGSQRLAIQQGGQPARVYDTGTHAIGGFSQQQGGDQSLTFTSQFGLVRVADLPEIGATVAPIEDPSPRSTPAPSSVSVAAPAPSGDVFTMIERLADLRQKGILTEEEFAAKKAELLSRL